MNTTISYKNTVAEYYDGSCVVIAQTPNFCEIEKNMFSFSISLKNDEKKIRKIKSTFSVTYDAEYALVHDFLESGIKPISELADDMKSEFYFALFDENGEGVTFLNKLPCKFYSEMHYMPKEKEITFETVIPYSFEGDAVAEEFVVACGVPYTYALEYNAKMCGVKQEWENVIGWGSWDYYFTSIDEDAVKENTDFIAGDAVLRDKIKYIAIDDGWQQREGDWREGMRFPSGLKATTDYIRSKGYIAGIWTAPTRLHNLCGTVMRRNDFLVRNEYGDPVTDEEFYVLDPTHPDGETFIRETFTYLKNAGFGFYKIDFLSNLLKCDRFYDTSAGPYDALRKLIKTIRECVGEESHIMGCALPYGYGGADVNSRRTGLDIHNTWKHIAKCTEIFYPAVFAQRRLYQNDMDYLVVRGAQTTTERDTNVFNPAAGRYAAEPTKEFRWRDGKDFDYAEAKFWCTEILMTGSSVILSDRMTALNERGKKLVYTTVKNADFDAAFPVDNGGHLPEIWYKKSVGALYVFNFSAEKKEYTVNVADLYGNDVTLTDIFENEKYVSENGILKISLETHESVALYLK